MKKLKSECQARTSSAKCEEELSRQKNGKLRGPQAGPNLEHSRSIKEAHEAGAMSNEKSSRRGNQSGDVWRPRCMDFCAKQSGQSGEGGNQGCDMI